MSILIGLLLIWGGIVVGLIALAGGQWRFAIAAAVAIFIGWLFARDW